MFDKRTHAEAVAQAQYTNHLTTFSQVPVYQEGFLVYIAQTLITMLHIAERRPSILKQLVGKTPKPFKLQMECPAVKIFPTSEEIGDLIQKKNIDRRDRVVASMLLDFHEQWEFIQRDIKLYTKMLRY